MHTLLMLVTVTTLASYKPWMSDVTRSIIGRSFQPLKKKARHSIIYLITILPKIKNIITPLTEWDKKEQNRVFWHSWCIRCFPRGKHTKTNAWMYWCTYNHYLHAFHKHIYILKNMSILNYLYTYIHTLTKHIHICTHKSICTLIRITCNLVHVICT